MISLTNQQLVNDSPVNKTETPVLCDFCNESRALLYCRADSAKLCFTCDREVHSTNPLFKKHSRSLLCNSCNSSPVSIFCCSESAVFCQNCDWETHKTVQSVHDRRPIEGFNGCPTVCELLSVLGFEDLGKKNLEIGSDVGFSDLLVWETPSVVSIDDLIGTNDSHSFQVMGVPPLPKNRNATCGIHKEEILGQLREMAKTEPNFSGNLNDFVPHVEIQPPQVPGKCRVKESSPAFETNVDPSVPSYETNSFQWGDYTGGFADEGFSSNLYGSFVDMNHIVPDKDSDVGDCSNIANGFQDGQSCNPVNSKIFHVKAERRELNSQERGSAITRYKEKKKTRRFDKHIRYESRKVRAESRTRIKGRFAKMDR